MAKRVQVVLNEDVLSLGKDGDLVEVAPPFDPTGNTALTGATLMFEILCVVAQSLSRR